MEKKGKCIQKINQKSFSLMSTRPWLPGGIIYFMAIFLFSILLNFNGYVWADGIYSYIDKNGVYHFTNVPTDPRFSKIEIDEKSVVLKGRGRRARRSRRNRFAKLNAQKRINAFKHEIEKAAGFFGLDPALIKAVIRAESGGNPRAVSSKGALGLMQLMPQTAKELMVYDPLDPAENIWGGSKYLSWLVENFNGDIIAALAAYNSGPGTVERYGGIPPYPETIQYIKRVLKFWKQAKNDS